MAMIERSIGYQYLVEKFDLHVCELLVKSYLTTESQKKVVRKDDFSRVIYPKSRVTVADTWQGNLLFAIRNEGVNLEVLKSFFNRLSNHEMEVFVNEHPTGGVIVACGYSTNGLPEGRWIFRRFNLEIMLILWMAQCNWLCLGSWHCGNVVIA